MKISYRNSASFGKRMEYWIIGLMLKEGMDVYMPLVDDDGIDAVIKRNDGSFIEVQIKARSNTVQKPSASRFAAITHKQKRKNYFFIFYSERLKTFWIMTSEEFIKEAVQNKSGENEGKRSICFNLKRKNKTTGEYDIPLKPQFEKYIEENFSRLY
jgi:hypothetical protein